MAARLTALLPALLLACSASLAQCPSGLRVGFNDAHFPPMLNGSGEQFATPDPGWLVRVAQRALAATGCSAEWVRRPVRRLEAELASGRIGIGLLFGATEERLTQMAFPLDARGRPDESLALVISELSLYALPERATHLGWDGRRVAAGRRIGVVRGTAQDQVAQALGLPLEPISNFPASLAMLRAGRFDALLGNPEMLSQRAEAADLVKLQPSLKRLAYFAAAHPKLRTETPDFLPRFWQALCRAMRDEPQAPRSACAAP